MGKFTITEYPNLVFADEAYLSNIKFPSKNVKLNVLKTLHLLNMHGTNSDFIGKKVENTGRKQIWELKIKGPSKTEWRFLFKRIPHPDNPRKHRYGLLYFFQKTTEEISKRDFDTAVKIAKREGW